MLTWKDYTRSDCAPHLRCFSYERTASNRTCAPIALFNQSAYVSADFDQKKTNLHVFRSGILGRVMRDTVPAADEDHSSGDLHSSIYTERKHMSAAYIRISTWESIALTSHGRHR